MFFYVLCFFFMGCLLFFIVLLQHLVIWVENLEMCAFIFAGAFSKLKTKNEMGAFILGSAPCDAELRMVRLAALKARPLRVQQNYDVDTTQLRLRWL